ncbi:MAG: lipopolysaccharide export system protein LptA [Planctomycetota bacterium]|jgi:lipopolysaccharide export system protein LptA
MTTVKFIQQILIYGLLLAISGSAQALSTDTDQAIEVEADSLEIREKDNISVYSGNVKLMQGSMEITSDRLVIHFDANNELQLMEMSGSPARFRQIDNNDQQMLGQAKRINYAATDDTLELIEDARFDRGGNTIEGNLIRINTETNSIQAGSSESDHRVKMLIQPKKPSKTGSNE